MSASAPARPTLRKGGEAAAEASKQAAFSRGNRLHSLVLADKESILVRYVTDYSDWIYTAQHNVVPTKSAPLGDDGKPVPNWPKAMTAVCRYDEIFKESGYYSDCYICDAKIQSQYGKAIGNAVRIWALAIVREEVIGDGSEALGGPEMKGKRVGTTDKMVEVKVVDKEGKETGETVWQREYVLVNFAYSNYFSGLAACYSEFNTCCDRDYKIKRVGDDKDTTYVHIALDATPNLKPGTEKWQTKYLDDLKERDIDLEAIVLDKATDEYYARFFDPTKTWSNKGGVSDSGVTPEAAASAEPTEEDKDRMQALRDRVQGAAKPSSADID
jgi:hypothetical protein